MTQEAHLFLFLARFFRRHRARAASITAFFSSFMFGALPYSKHD